MFGKLFDSLKTGLSKTRNALTDKINETLKLAVTIDEDLYEELEEILIMADIGMDTTMDIIERLKDKIRKEKINDVEMVQPALKEVIAEMMHGATEAVEEADKKVVFVIGVNGVGKTTTSANIGTALAKNGHSVVLIDTDIGLRNLDLLLGLENRIVYTLVDVVEERCKLKQALVKDKKNPKLCLLAAAQTRDKSSVNAEQLKKITDKLKKDYDFVLVDCPAGIEQGFQTAIAGASEAIVVTTPEMSAVRDADRIIGLL